MADVEQNIVSSEPAVEKSEETLFDPSLKKKKKSKSKPTFDLDDEVDDVKSELEKKKKKKKEKKEKSAEEESREGTPAETEESTTGEFEFKKKKKKSKSATATFEAQLEEAGIEGEDNEKAPTPTIKSKYTNVNADGEPDFTYEELLSRFFTILRENNPDLAGDRSGVKYKIPPPAVARDGNKKSLFSNVKDIADRMHRPTEHVIQFLFAELGTSGSVDGSNRLVIKGRFQQKQIETVLRRYIMEYVTCKTCKSVNTKLSKENRLYFLECNSCGSRRSVSSIKTGYQAIIKRGRK